MTSFASQLLLLFFGSSCDTRLRMIDDGLDGLPEDKGADHFARGMKLLDFFHLTQQVLQTVFRPVGLDRRSWPPVVFQWTHCSGDSM